jgi:hypothetical protein
MWMMTVCIYKRGSKGGFIHASRAVGSILLSTSDICIHHMHAWTEQCCNAATHSSLITQKGIYACNIPPPNIIRCMPPGIMNLIIISL